MIELEKQRMEAAKELELQRMNMLMDMQMELERSKLGKRKAAAASGDKEGNTMRARHGPIHHLCWLDLFIAAYMIGSWVRVQARRSHTS
ncbi:hypothetical protein DY000_02045721 [Brassica cretica]|uniref:GTD-binding domain-containing protein n=1 Tax=Brassica cretica TaxID=69181 RepID=A0ABQ7ETY3_BRACR|nr:hypothetical protein DY000_02045721 [Brassica cretica]